MPTRELVSRDTRRLDLGGEGLDYVLARRRGRRGVGFKVDESGLTVSAPLGMPVTAIEALVRDSEAWIVRKLGEWKHKQVPHAEWHDGARIPFLGGGLTLRLFSGRSGAVREGAELWVRTAASTPAQVQRAVVGWYKAQAREFLAGRLAKLADAAGLRRPLFTLSSALGRWGSCNSRAEVRLTWRLMKAPPELIDYVVCHELAHLRHMDHSAAFWAEVARQCADYKALRERLHETDHLYRSF
jgi:predicted metal-dependent hydrolase